MRFLNEMDLKIKSLNTKINDETVDLITSLFSEQQRQNGTKEEVIESRGEKVISPSEIRTVGDLINKCNLSINSVMTVVLQKGLSLNINSEIDFSIAKALCSELDLDLISSEEGSKVTHDNQLKGELDFIDNANAKTNEKRPPVVTVMGHVDHGKTRLLDTIRKTNVTDKEAGGITQHLAAYQIEFKNKRITFLDTPGHEAFTALRARGSQVTDIVILVVAADDSVQPQTIEAIHHAKAANTPIIVAINKVDKETANIEQCKQDLAQHDLLAEDWGGSVVMVPISAKNGTGIEELLDMVLLLSDVEELTAIKAGLATAVVLEAHLDKQRGPVASILVKSGTLNLGDFISVGSVSGKVRVLRNDRDALIKTVGPGSPAELVGLSVVPSPGLIIRAHESEKDARYAIEHYQSESGQASNITSVSLDTLSTQIKAGNVKKLNIVVKADVQGSIEAIANLLLKIPSLEVAIQIIHSGSGAVTENDIMLAKASSAIVIAFGIKTQTAIQKMAKLEGVMIKEYDVIYNIVEDIEKALAGYSGIEYEFVETGSAEVLEIFKFSKVGIIAGCIVKSGAIQKNNLIEQYRNKQLIFKGEMASLKRFKDDVKEVKSSFECGIVIDNHKDVIIGDEFKCFKKVRKTIL